MAWGFKLTGGEVGRIIQERNILEAFRFQFTDYQGESNYLLRTDVGTVVGEGAGGSGEDVSAVGAFSVVGDRWTTAVGAYTRATVEGATAIGAFAQTLKAKGTTVGYKNYVNGLSGVCIGTENDIQHDDVILIGNGLSSTEDDEINIGNRIRVYGNGTIEIDGLDLADLPTSYEEGSEEVSFGNGSKGSWTQLIASTASRTTELVVSLEALASTGPIRLDIGTGASSSEVVLIPDIWVETAPASNGGALVWRFRTDIAASTRIAARGQDASGTTYVVQVIAGQP